MIKNTLKKFITLGLVSVICISQISIGNITISDNNFISNSYAATIKDTAYSATGKTTANLNVRKGPNTTYSKVGSLKKGSKVTIVAKSSNGWYKIKFNNSHGYVSSQYISITSNNVSETKYSATGKATANLNIRKGPNTTYSKVGSLKKGAKVTIVAKSSNSWYKIKFNNSYGYVSSKYITITNNKPSVTETSYYATGYTTTNLNVRKGPSTTYSKIDYLYKEDFVYIVAKTSNGWYKIITDDDSYGYVSSKYVILDEVEEYEFGFVIPAYTTANLNVRTGPNTNYSKIGSLSKNSDVQVVAMTSNGWLKIKYNKGFGYVFADYIDVSDEVLDDILGDILDGLDDEDYNNYNDIFNSFLSLN